MGKLTLDRQRNKKNKKRGGERGSATFEDEFRINGGGLGESGTFSYGYASRPGRRFWPIMEDFYRIDDGVEGGKVVGLFGVFDGHDGAGAAKYVKKNLFDNLLDHPKFISDTKSAIADAYSTTDSEFLNNKAEDISGSTALTAVLVGDCLLVANVGDSRAVICRAGKAVAVSRDHKPDQPDELQRIEDAGGEVTTGRVENRLAVSRSFGHRELKEFVIADPEIHEEEVDDTLEFLILASDGIWDVLTNEEAVSMVVPIRDPKEAAERLMEEAFLRRSLDNISVIVVRFLAPSHKNASTSLLFIICFPSIIIILFLLLFLLS